MMPLAGGIFHGVAQQVIDDGFHLFLVEEYLVVAGPRSETHGDVLLLGYGRSRSQCLPGALRFHR